MSQPLDYEARPHGNSKTATILFVTGIGVFCASLGWVIGYPRDIAFPILMAIGGMTAARAWVSLR